MLRTILAADARQFLVLPGHFDCRYLSQAESNDTNSLYGDKANRRGVAT